MGAHRRFALKGNGRRGRPSLSNHHPRRQLSLSLSFFGIVHLAAICLWIKFGRAWRASAEILDRHRFLTALRTDGALQLALGLLGFALGFQLSTTRGSARGLLGAAGRLLAGTGSTILAHHEIPLAS
jgi:hypothetical protein